MSVDLGNQTVVEIPADSAGWVDTGVSVESGQAVTLLATGCARLAGGPEEPSFGPHLFLCYRVHPGGDFDKLPASTTTFVADRAGRLELIVHFPGAWLDRQGGLDAAWPRGAACGSYRVTILVWPSLSHADDGLAALAVLEPLARVERQRLLDPVQLPADWEPVWRTGATEIYREHADADAGVRISCRSEHDGGLITYPVDQPLTERTRLAWQWRVLSLPSRVAEDSLLTHDYLSIAVEFDNGRDLTYMWSSTLPVGTSFACPFPWWDNYETHQVVRSGTAELGRWLEEEQPVLADYVEAIGGPPPQRIVAVWLIAVAIFQGGLGECEYRAIAVRN